MDETEQRRVDTQETIRQFTHKRDLDLQRDFNEVDSKERHYTKFYTSNNGIYRSQFMNVPLYDEGSMRLVDFVHANRITTPETGGYIIAQSPLVKPEPPRMDTTLIELVSKSHFCMWLCVCIVPLCSSRYRMIWSCDVRVIVSLVHLGNEENCSYYFPSEKGVLKIGDFKIITENKRTQLDWNWTNYQLRIVQKAEKKERKLIVIVCNNWTDDPATNKLNSRNLVDLLDFVWTVEADMLRQWKEQKGSLDVQSRPPPTLVHSRAGMNRAGCYIAASICGKMMKQPGPHPHSYNLRRIIAICRQMRHARYDVFCSRTMFVLLLETLLEIAAKLGLVDRERTAKARRVLIKACMNIHGSSRQPLCAPDPANRSRRFGGSSTSRTTTSDE